MTYPWIYRFFPWQCLVYWWARQRHSSSLLPWFFIFSIFLTLIVSISLLEFEDSGFSTEFSTYFLWTLVFSFTEQKNWEYIITTNRIVLKIKTIDLGQVRQVPSFPFPRSFKGLDCMITLVLFSSWIVRFCEWKGT